MIRKMAMTLMAAVAVVCFASCNKSDDNGGITPDSSSYYGEMHIKLTVSQDVLNVANIKITYTDANSKEQTEDLTSTTFTKDIKFASLPAKAKYKVSYTAKENVSKNEFTISINDESSARKTDGKSSPTYVESKYSATSDGVTKDLAIESIKRYCESKGFDTTLEK